MIRLFASAKLNLYLRVLGKRPDGFHELETIFQRVSLFDTLTFESQAETLSLTCDLPGLSCREDNLVLRAARLLQQESGTKQGARIHLSKKIPLAAGLGGGSSDAAATLSGLNKLWDLGFDQQTLVWLSKRLGSDIAFFLHDASFAIGRGRGEECEVIPAKTPLWQVLVMPDACLSTAEIFGNLRLDLTAKKPDASIIKHALCNGSLGELASALWNDLEPEAIRRCPVISTIQSNLISLGCPGVRLSGSGPSVFGLCRDAPSARAVAQRLSENAPKSWRIETVQTA